MKNPAEAISSPTSKATLFVAGAVLLLCLLAIQGCADRQRRNPLDPEAVSPEDTATPLDAMARDGQVLLSWDYSQFTDVSGFRLFRRGGGVDLVRDLPSESVDFVDEEVVNGATYVYELALVIGAEGERRLGSARIVTPGPELAWVSDRGSGLVWQLTPDGRQGVFAQGRFPSLSAIAVNRSDRSCWVSDRRTPGLYRIDSGGDLRLLDLDLGAPGDLSIDSGRGVGWVADQSEGRVFQFSTSADLDSLELTQVDASFEEPFSLAAVGASCWIVDRAAERVLLYDGEAGRRTGEWRDLDRPGRVAAAVSPAGDALQEAWVLIGDGGGLVKLDRDREPLFLELPFPNGVSLAVDSRTGDCWVLGETKLAAFSRTGALLFQFDGAPDGRDLAIDGPNRQVWIAGSTVAWKFAMLEQDLVQLAGFSGLHRIQVDPGGAGG